MPENMTTAEVAEYLRVAPETCRYWRWRGEGPPALKAGRRVLYRRSEVEAWLERQRQTPSGAGAA